MYFFFVTATEAATSTIVIVALCLRLHWLWHCLTHCLFKVRNITFVLRRLVLLTATTTLIPGVADILLRLGFASRYNV